MKCKYCGLSAGLFSRAHRECEEKHRRGEAELLAALHGYFTCGQDIGSVAAEMRRARAEAFFTDDDVAACCREALRRFADALRLPVTRQHLLLLDGFLHGCGSRQRLSTAAASCRRWPAASTRAC